MWPTLLRLLTTHPLWVGEHVQAYASLLNAELGSVARAWRRRAMWQALALGNLVVALALTGMAMMLWAVTPTLQAAALWMLWLVPIAALVLAAVCLWVAGGGHRDEEVSMSLLAEQWQADQALLRSLAAS